jgi:succinyl-CoA synthetase beta subunit
MRLGDETSNALLVEEKLDIERELYLGITFDHMEKMPVLLLSGEGGVDIENHVTDDSAGLQRMVLNPLHPPFLDRLTALCLGTGLCNLTSPKVAEVAKKLIAGYFRFDAITAEINPLVVDVKGDVVAADAKLELDPSAAFRFPAGIPRERKAGDIHPLEVEASNEGLAYVKLEGGDIGVIAGGAGLSMATMDMVVEAGGRPANFLDLGGGASSKKTASALRMVLKTPGVKGVIMNLFGGINNCEVMADGIAEVVLKDTPSVPIVVKMRGYSQDEGWRILEGVDIPTVKHGTTESAVSLLMEKVTGKEKS